MSKSSAPKNTFSVFQEDNVDVFSFLDDADTSLAETLAIREQACKQKTIQAQADYIPGENEEHSLNKMPANTQEDAPEPVHPGAIPIPTETYWQKEIQKAKKERQYKQHTLTPQTFSPTPASWVAKTTEDDIKPAPSKQSSTVSYIQNIKNIQEWGGVCDLGGQAILLR